jgi:hypothetical protein
MKSMDAAGRRPSIGKGLESTLFTGDIAHIQVVTRQR